MMDTRGIYITYGDDALTMGRTLLEASGAHELFRPGMSVAVKPNLVVAKPASSGATTHTGFAEAVLAAARDCGVTDLRIIESSWVGADTMEAFSVCGYDELARRYGARLVDLKRDKSVEVVYREEKAWVCAEALEVDCLVNLPVLKAHCQTVMTCAIKNLKGCIPDREKRRYHAEGLFAPIAVLPRLVPTAFSLVDAICGDLTFEEGGTPAPMFRAMLGADPVTVDGCAAAWMGLSPQDVPYLPLAEEIGAGYLACDYMKEVGERPEHHRGHLQYTQQSAIRRLGAHIKEDGACSACYGAILRALHTLKENGVTPMEPVHVGQGYKGKTKNGLGVGSCCAGFSQHVPGCPPPALDIVNAIKGGSQ